MDLSRGRAYLTREPNYDKVGLQLRFGNSKTNAAVIHATNARHLTFALGQNDCTGFVQGGVHRNLHRAQTGEACAALLPHLTAHDYS